MNITRIQTFYNPISIPNVTETNKKSPNGIENTNMQVYSPNYAYNVAFHGLLSNKENYINAKFLTSPLKVEAGHKYLINKNSKLILGNSEIELRNIHIKRKINALKENESIIIGRAALHTDDMDNSVSRQHIRLTKHSKNELILEDLNSQNGTTIEKNIITPEAPNTPLLPNKNYLLPKNAIIYVHNIPIYLEKYQSKIEKLKGDKPFIIGRGITSDAKFSEEFFNKKHLEIRNNNKGYIVTNISYDENVKYRGTSKNTNVSQKYNLDYSQLEEEQLLPSAINIKIPTNCQLRLGNDYIIDLRNKNILDKLEQKGNITVGRDPNCDIKVAEFYNDVSRKHLMLIKAGDTIIANNTSSNNSTTLIPNKKIKVFYNGVSNIEMSQGNVGDCYLLAVLYALSITGKGQKILKNMVDIDKDGNYYVKFNNNKVIKVKPEELDGQSSTNGKKFSVSGELGIKAIERGYAKLIKSDYIGDTMFLDIDNGGDSLEAMKHIADFDTCNVFTQDAKIEERLSRIADLDPHNIIMTCSSNRDAKYEDYVDPEKRFFYRHAYTVKSINKEKKTIKIVNPHNTKFEQTLSWEDFTKYFYRICIASLDNIDVS